MIKFNTYLLVLALTLMCMAFINPRPLHAQTDQQNPQNKTSEPAGQQIQAPNSFEAPPPLPRAKPIFKVWTVEEIKRANEICSAVLKKENIIAKRLPAIADYDGCGDPSPLLVSQILTKREERIIPVIISPPATLNCKMAEQTAQWLTHNVQETSQNLFNQPIVKIHNVASYHCRKRYNAIEGKMSEHAFANALDISAFSLADGTKISLVKHWAKDQAVPSHQTKTEEVIKITKPALVAPAPQLIKTKPAAVPDKEPAESMFLKSIHKAACSKFSTVLGPESNAAHADHFHLDLGRNGRYQICE